MTGLRAARLAAPSPDDDASGRPTAPGGALTGRRPPGRPTAPSGTVMGRRPARPARFAGHPARSRRIHACDGMVM